MNCDLTNYYYLLAIQSITFDIEGTKDILKEMDNKLPMPLFIECLIAYVNYITDKEYIENKYKINLYEIINVIKKASNSVITNSKMNDLIIKLNICNGINCDTFYALQLAKRSTKIKLKGMSFDDYEILKESIITSLVADYYILNICLNISSEKEFDEFMNNYQMTIAFFFSLRAMINDQSVLIENDIFFARVNKLINFNDTVLYDYDLSKHNVKILTNDCKRIVKIFE